ncbi:MAG: hypothetical protein K6E54_01565 [Bacteroidaceae bacterium]|nr:hypothetical protein [Bacteroidaceae bacterium]
MEEKNITEKESLELITQMIQQTKDNLPIGSGTTFLIWGYTSVIIGCLVWILQLLNFGNSAAWIYVLLPFIGCLLSILYNRKPKEGIAENYSTYMINSIWKLVSYSFIIAAIIIVYFIIFHKQAHTIIFFVLGLLLPGIGTAVTGLALKEKSAVVGGFLGITFGIAAMEMYILNSTLTIDWHLGFAASYAIMMVIPGHLINDKAKKQNNGRT